MGIVSQVVGWYECVC